MYIWDCWLYLMQADDNEDRKLTLDEMLDHEFAFFNTVHADGHVEIDDGDHDELWLEIIVWHV